LSQVPQVKVERTEALDYYYIPDYEHL